MPKIYNSLAQLVGKTPLLELSKYTAYNLNARVIAKLEYRNPAGSVQRPHCLRNDKRRRGGECSRGVRLLLSPLAAILASVLHLWQQPGDIGLY